MQLCKKSYRFLLPALLLLLSITKGVSQCADWGIRATLTATSSCAANGSFTVSTYGTDAPNLSNIQYAIPISPNGFSVPLNNSASFSNIPPGTYTVSAVASCNGNLVGKNTTITVPGSYSPPILSAYAARNSLTCGSYGKITAYMLGGAAPYTYNITGKPASYTGPTTFTRPDVCTINNLPAGTYTIQAVDVCGSGTVPRTVTVGGLAVSTLPLRYLDPTAYNCDTFLIYKPYVDVGSAGWSGYNEDSLFSVSMQINGGLLSPTAFQKMNYNPFQLRIPAGKSVKDYYGKTITYTIQPPCGSNITGSQTIPTPYVQPSVVQNCNKDFVATFGFYGPICYPISYTVRNTTTGTTYGPYSTTTNYTATPPLPIGPYTMNYTTADGYSGSASFGTSLITGNPYSISIYNNGTGLHNYIEGFVITTSASLGAKTVELFNGPAGYSYSQTWYGSGTFYMTQNQTPGAGTIYYKPGYYVWKVTDNCGTYYLPITVTGADVYSFTAGMGLQQQTCAGLKIYPSGSASINGVSKPVNFSLLKNGEPYIPPPTFKWIQYPLNTPILITEPGEYTLLPSAYLTTFFFNRGSYPNVYTNTYRFTYNIYPVKADINKTQGFICVGAATGQGKIFATGKDGMPFKSPAIHYNYYLAAKGKGASGPYITSNTTGVFTGFGGNANDVFDVKIEDSCGAFAVQQVKILDLLHTRLISSSNYVACEHNNVQLQAIYLPGATYSWTGPAGFTSSIRNPVISNITAANIGSYRVAITTPECNQSVTDSTLITMNGNPPKPLTTITCGDPVTITITNPSAAYNYEWDSYLEIGGPGGYIYHTMLPSDTLYSRYVYIPGSYTAVATDTTTGCSTFGDSLHFGANPGAPLIASIYSPHLKICTGDTTILVARGATTAQYQWIKDGMLIPGATSISYSTSIPGDYQVSIDAGPCSLDTSDVATVTVVAYPTAAITSAKTDICAGETLTIQANSGADYQYTWYRNGITIPGANNDNLGASDGGNYYLIISNGGCVTSSNTITINLHAKPVVHLNPDTDQDLCIGDMVHFSTLLDTSYRYSWYHDGNILAGITVNTLDTRTPGTYIVKARSRFCADESSNAVKVALLPMNVNLGRDTTVCDTGAFAIPLSVATGFDDILWSDGTTGNTTLANKKGLWWVTASNKCGKYTDTVLIYTLTDYLPNLPDDTIICNESNAAKISVPELLGNVMWSTGATTYDIAVQQPGIYWVQGEGPCGILSDTVAISFCAPIIENILPADDSICEGGCISFKAMTANYPQKYLWTFEGGNPATDTQPEPKACYALPGVYDVKLEVSNAGGNATHHTTAYVLPKPKPAFADTSLTASYKSTLVLPACADAQRIQWFINDSLVCDGCKTLAVEARLWKAVYKCVVSNGDCTDQCTYKLATTDIPSDIWMPSAFSPNGDGLNDYFRIITDNPNIVIAELSVYNRFGQKIYGGSRDSKGWDGKFKGELVDVGTYYWQIRYAVNGRDQQYYLKGDLTIVK